VIPESALLSGKVCMMPRNVASFHATDEERLRPGRSRRDHPALDIARAAPGASAAATYRVEEVGEFRIAPGLGAVSGTAELGPAPKAAP
jgi:hypothetical protein